MRARDVMTLHVITVGPDMNVRAVANTLIKNKISAVPVAGIDYKLLGIVSEGDLIRRVEAGTQSRRSWWLDLFTSSDTLAAKFAKSHAQKAKDVMTHDVITANPGTRLRVIANLLEKHRIKRVPIVENDRLVGIVSRANLIQVLAGQKAESFEIEPSDASVRQTILGQLENQPWAKRPINIVVQGGVVDLWGHVNSDEEKKAIRVAVEATPGVRSVNDNLHVYPPLAPVY
jgi:CBS domain-containing protein